MEQNNEYFVFISYSSLDNEWAIWLRHELEHYHLPASFNGRTDVRDNLRKVFRDRDELSAGPEWDEQVQKALEETNNLIVICSPHSAKSDAVNKEIETFIALGKEDHIFPFIVEGDNPEDCFPKALKHSKLAGDIIKDGSPNIAFIKIVAGMLNVGFSELWNRYEIEKAEEEQKIREQRDKLLIMQSRFLAEKANALVEEGDSYTARLLALEALPKDLENPDRPYVSECEVALRLSNDYEHKLLKGHTDSIICCTYDASGRYVATSSLDGTIKIWEIQTTKCLKTLGGFTSFVRSLCFTSDGSLLIIGDNNGTVQACDINTWNCNSICQDYYAGVSAKIACHPNERKILVPSHSNTLKVLNLDNLSSLPIIINSINNEKWAHFYCATYSHNGRYIASIEYDNIIRIRDSVSGMCIRECNDVNDDANYYALTFNYDDTLLAFSSREHIKVVLIETGEIIRSLEGHKNYVTSACFHPMVNMLVTSDGLDLRIWDVSQGICKKTYPKKRIYGQISFSPNGENLLFSVENAVQIWDLKGKTSIMYSLPFMGFNSHIFYSSTQKYFAITRREEIKIYNATNCNLECELKCEKSTIKTIIFSLDDNYLLSFMNNGNCIIWDIKECHTVGIASSKNETLYGNLPNLFSYNSKFYVRIDGNHAYISCTKDGSDYKKLSSHSWNISYVEFKRDDSAILTVDSSSIKIHNTYNGKCIQNIPSEYEQIFTTAHFNPNGTQLIIKSIVTEDEYLSSLWDIENEKILMNFKGLIDFHFSSDGQWLVVMIKGEESVLLNTETLEHINLGESYRVIQFCSRRNLLLASHNYDIDVFDLTTKKIKTTFKHNTSFFNMVGVSPDEQYFLSQDSEYIYVWNISSGNLIHKIDGGTHVSWSVDGNHFSFLNSENNYCNYNFLALNSIIEENHAFAKEFPLDIEERKKYYLD